MDTENSPLLDGKPIGNPPEARRLPQTIAHRGYKAAFPENTMGAFQGAVAVGAHAIETDLHLSRDGVVVLSHDPTLKRCFGINEKIADHDWSYLSTLRTLREPKQPMPRLSDLLEYLAQPGLESTWILLDIKVDDDPDDLLSRVATTISSIPSQRPWKERIILGAWNEHYMTLCKTHLPTFPIAYIGFSWLYARRFLPDPEDLDRKPQIHFNMFQKTLVGPAGSRFIRSVRRAGRSLFVWTVNDDEWMEWSVRKGVDGVITDDPKLFLDVCERFRDDGDDENQGGSPGGADGKARVTKRTRIKPLRTVRIYLDVAAIQLMVFVMLCLFWSRLGKLGTKKKGANGKR